jgi:hypothetical protein
MYETAAPLNVLNGSKLLILFMLWKEHLRETITSRHFDVIQEKNV